MNSNLCVTHICRKCCIIIAANRKSPAVKDLRHIYSAFAGRVFTMCDA